MISYVPPGVQVSENLIVHGTLNGPSPTPYSPRLVEEGVFSEVRAGVSIM
jgi:hypothetical protein